MPHDVGNVQTKAAKDSACHAAVACHPSMMSFECARVGRVQLQQLLNKHQTQQAEAKGLRYDI